MPKKTPGGRNVVLLAKRHRKEQLAKARHNRERKAAAVMLSFLIPKP